MTIPGNVSISLSDIIQVIGIIASFAVSVIAIVISIFSLRQNSKMIEDSTRPYIGIYGNGVYVKTPTFYIILKNFGQSSAFIRAFSCDLDLTPYVSASKKRQPFGHLQGSTILPGQSYRALINLHDLMLHSDHITFHMEYSTPTHTYSEDICLNLLSYTDNLVSHKIGQNQELSIISETLQDMHIHSL